MPQPPEELSQISAKTLAHYSEQADAFWQGTRDHDVQQNIAALLRHLPRTVPLGILDVGCGPGRDLMAFRALGHAPIGVEGSAPMADLARQNSGCEVWQQDFLELNLPTEHFDGVFANASLFHVPSQALPRVLQQLHATLKPMGVLFASNPRGDNQEGWNGSRYGVYHDLATWRAYLTEAGFTELEHYYRPAGLPREQQPWLASVWRKKAINEDH